MFKEDDSYLLAGEDLQVTFSINRPSDRVRYKQKLHKIFKADYVIEKGYYAINYAF